MNNVIGMIIKYNRAKNHISQAELSKGICVPSYLSKIENGEISAHRDICEKLLERLNVSYDEIMSKHDKDGVIKNIIDLIVNLKSSEAKTLADNLDVSLEQSPYVFEYLAIKYHYSNGEQSNLKSILLESAAHLDDKTSFFILMMLYSKNKDNTALLDRAIRTYACGYGYFIKGISLYREKSFNEAYECFQLSESEYLKSGSLFGIVHSKRHQAVMLSFRADHTRALEMFESVKRLLKDVNNPLFDGMILSCDYNINFLKFDMGMEHSLESICLEIIDKGAFENSVPYHVLSNVYKEGDPKKARQCLLDGMAKYSKKTTFDYLQLDLDMFKLDNNDYAKMPQYYTKLKAVRKSLEPNGNYGIKYSIEKEMIEYLKANRRYKEALEMTETLKELDY